LTFHKDTSPSHISPSTPGNRKNGDFVVVSLYLHREFDPMGFIALFDGKLCPRGYDATGQKLCEAIASSSIRLGSGKYVHPDDAVDWLDAAEHLSNAYQGVSPVIPGAI
jgi:hypothetical protein